MTCDVYVYGEAIGVEVDEPGDRWPGCGTDTLLVALRRPVVLEIDALGDRRFPAGGYAYTGSALGSGGFARVT